MDLEDKKYIDAGILGCNEETLNEDTDNLEEAFEPWKGDAWIRGERRENVSRMAQDTLLDYGYFLNERCIQAIRDHQTVTAMKCVNLMRELIVAARNKGYIAVAEDLTYLSEARRADISNLRNETNVRALFNPTTEDLNEEVEIHTTLNPLIWNEDETLKPEIEEKVRSVVKTFVDILTENKIRIKEKNLLMMEWKWLFLLIRNIIRVREFIFWI